MFPKYGGEYILAVSSGYVTEYIEEESLNVFHIYLTE